MPEVSVPPDRLPPGTSGTVPGSNDYPPSEP
jgi:hypothetical protein